MFTHVAVLSHMLWTVAVLCSTFQPLPLLPAATAAAAAVTAGLATAIGAATQACHRTWGCYLRALLLTLGCISVLQGGITAGKIIFGVDGVDPVPSCSYPAIPNRPFLTVLCQTLLQGDITAGRMIFGVDGVDPDRRRQLIQLLDIDLYQRLNTMSDGQRRRVQICMGLLKPYDVSAQLC